MRRVPKWKTRAMLEQQANARLDELLIERQKTRNLERAYRSLFDEMKRERQEEREAQLPDEQWIRDRWRTLRKRERDLEQRAEALAAKEHALAQIAVFGEANPEVLKAAGLPRNPTTPQSYGGAR